MKVLKGLLS